MSKHTPQDKVLSILALRGLDQLSSNSDEYADVYQDLGLDKADFYFSIKPHHYPDNINQFFIPEERALMRMMASEGIHRDKANQIIETYRKVQVELDAGSDGAALIALEQSRRDLNQFLVQLGMSPGSVDKTTLFYPVFRWHGTDNQYHLWLKQALYNGFGVSISDGKQASEKVTKALKWTLSFTLVDFFLSILIGVMIALYFASNPTGRFQNILRQALYLLYAMPLFWLATLMVVYFTTDDYGSITNIFPSVGMDIYPGKSTMQQILLNYKKLILPIICLGLHSMAYVTRMIENALNDEMKKDYVLLAFSRGRSKKDILRKEALRNALIPSVTLFMAAFANAFSGSLVIEVIFNIPGMGRLLFETISLADWNVVFCILMLVSLVTILAYLIADILYAFLNPKIKFE